MTLGILTVTQNAAVPEPQSGLLLLCGGGAVLVYSRLRAAPPGPSPDLI